jgi:hypothetical protein
VPDHQLMGQRWRIRRARPEEARQLSGLARRSKAYWGYDAEFLERVAADLTIPLRAIAEHQVWVLEADGRVIGFTGSSPGSRRCWRTCGWSRRRSAPGMAGACGSIRSRWRACGASAMELLRGRSWGVSSQASELRERKIGITSFDCPRDRCRTERHGFYRRRARCGWASPPRLSSPVVSSRGRASRWRERGVSAGGCPDEDDRAALTGTGRRFVPIAFALPDYGIRDRNARQPRRAPDPRPGTTGPRAGHAIAAPSGRPDRRG